MLADLPPCAVEFAAYYQVPMVVIEAVAEQEGGRPGTVSKNRNGTVDLGVMQINSSWFRSGSPVNLISLGITPDLVRDNACLNIAIGTWILSQYHAQMNYNWGMTLAAYNAGPGNWRAGINYAKSVVKRINRRLRTAGE